MKQIKIVIEKTEDHYSALERITGINQRQLQHYSSGLKKTRLVQKKKIQAALHQLGTELLAIVL